MTATFRDAWAWLLLGIVIGYVLVLFVASAIARRRDPLRAATERYERMVRARTAELVDRGISPFNADIHARREMHYEGDRMTQVFKAEVVE